MKTKNSKPSLPAKQPKKQNPKKGREKLIVKIKQQ
jgi:hypothetical protein